MAKRAARRQTWQQVAYTLSGGERVTKTVKTSLATYPVVGGILRVVMVKEADHWQVLSTIAISRLENRTISEAGPLRRCFHQRRLRWIIRDSAGNDFRYDSYLRCPPIRRPFLSIRFPIKYRWQSQTL